MQAAQVGTLVAIARAALDARRVRAVPERFGIGEEHRRTVARHQAERRAPGRGAHLHPTIECFDLAVQRKAFPRAFRVQGPLDVTGLREYVAQRDK